MKTQTRIAVTPCDPASPELGILPSKRASPTPTLPHFASTKITELDARVERLEKRLDLVDPALPEQP
jgi:hypothetical protein